VGCLIRPALAAFSLLLGTTNAGEPQFGMASGYEGLGEYVFFRQIVSIEE